MQTAPMPLQCGEPSRGQGRGAGDKGKEETPLVRGEPFHHPPEGVGVESHVKGCVGTPFSQIQLCASRNHEGNFGSGGNLSELSTSARRKPAVESALEGAELGFYARVAKVMNEGRDELVLVVLGDFPFATSRDKLNVSHRTEILHSDFEGQLHVATLAVLLDSVEAIVAVCLMCEQLDLVLVEHGVDALDVFCSWLQPQHLFDEEGGEMEPWENLSVEESNSCHPSGHLQPLFMVLVYIRSRVWPQRVSAVAVWPEHPIPTVSELGGDTSEPLTSHARPCRVLARENHIEPVLSCIA
mmetsp:Transcript_6977/g.17086  ORF Transcript_6977/g.17086 Transcript_6977/m.17086 type:complete len:298 (-) Transcript_6977:985-1878(-)